MTEATYDYIDTAEPSVEVFDITSAFSDTNTLTSRKFVRPRVVGVAFTDASYGAGDGVYFTYSSNVITMKVVGTGRTCTVMVREGSITG